MYSHLILQIQERHNDPLVFHHGIKARWTLATITAQRLIQQKVPEIQIPFLTLHGTADLVVNISSSYFLMEHTKSEDKMIKVCMQRYAVCFGLYETRLVYGYMT